MNETLHEDPDLDVINNNNDDSGRFIITLDEEDLLENNEETVTDEDDSTTPIISFDDFNTISTIDQDSVDPIDDDIDDDINEYGENFPEYDFTPIDENENQDSTSFEEIVYDREEDDSGRSDSGVIIPELQPVSNDENETIIAEETEEIEVTSPIVEEPDPSTPDLPGPDQGHFVDWDNYDSDGDYNNIYNNFETNEQERPIDNYDDEDEDDDYYDYYEEDDDDEEEEIEDDYNSQDIIDDTEEEHVEIDVRRRDYWTFLGRKSLNF